ncbi:GNAT family N-acetyltransferase [Terrilactibacillus laevilacticus]|uniref:GNAT family N-acetyltransferase n=1 Tax=Terrilactibacillus laevilacticus TaxID=1380157 RepID=A0ABW5PLM4_9BACI|nr:GNAT family protein [Terrilactibacillus laevilacticus]
MVQFKINENIDLKVLEMKDASTLFTVIDNERHELREYVPWVDHFQSESDVYPIIEIWNDQFKMNMGMQMGIFYKNKFVGMVEFQKYDWRNKSTSMGYWLVSSARGKGIMTTCCHALIDYGFNVLGLNRIEIRAASQNDSSRAVARRLGFIHEGHIRSAEWLHGHYIDHDLYGLLQSDWYKREYPNLLSHDFNR